MIKYFCDVCKKEIVDLSQKVEIITNDGTRHCHSRCVAEAINAEIGRRSEVIAQPHPAPKPIPDKKPGKKKPGNRYKISQDKIDTLKALWESNRSGRRAKPWTTKQMADEVGCSEVTVNNYIKMFEADVSA